MVRVRSTNTPCHVLLFLPRSMHLIVTLASSLLRKRRLGHCHDSHCHVSNRCLPPQAPGALGIHHAGRSCSAALCKHAGASAHSSGSCYNAQCCNLCGANVLHSWTGQFNLKQHAVPLCIVSLLVKAQLMLIYCSPIAPRSHHDITNVLTYDITYVLPHVSHTRVFKNIISYNVICYAHVICGNS